ncbi:MAG: carboxypeptidase regulatory-like domain-containing protein [Bacteroidales bacterium]|nr:carboxypeptidase regulatory-like domain-containing protein [Bacteroidales bacterium]
MSKIFFPSMILLLYSFMPCSGQEIDSLRYISGTIVSSENLPVPYTHVINLRTGRGMASDSSGRFKIRAFSRDSILFRNLSYEETIQSAENIISGDTIRLTDRYFAIKELRIYTWGSSYADMRAKMKSMPVTENIAEKLGLPQQSGNPVSNFRNPEVLSNPLFAYTNPVDFLYYNLSKKEKSIRKVMEIESNAELIKRFESVYNRNTIGNLTGLADEELDKFLIYLNLNILCDFHCTEIQVVKEIFSIWEEYKNKSGPH